MKRYFIKINESNVHITEWGNSDNPVIFCLHGLGSSSLSFIEIGEGLLNQFRIISIDAPGHGKTTAFEQETDYEIPNMVSWISNILDALKIDRFYFLSHSWGSFVALHFLAHYPDRIKGSILIDGGYQIKREQEISLEQEVDYYEKNFDDYIFDSWDDYLKEEQKNYQRWSSLLELAVKDLMIEDNKKIRWHVRGKTARRMIHAMYKYETVDIYNLLPNSIILLRATLPRDLEEHRDKIAKVFQQMTGGIVKPIKGTIHMLHWDKPDVVVAEILSSWI
ncbi:alpha/beta hydrolase [Lutispora saccharofermentans]